MITLTDLQAHFGEYLYTASFTGGEDAALALIRDPRVGKRLAIIARFNDPLRRYFEGQSGPFRGDYYLTLCPFHHANANALRQVLPNLQPKPLGLTTTVGCGDRLGLATPGHARAFETVLLQDGTHPISPLFAQQSTGDIENTGRTPDDVLTDATFGAFEAGWRGPVGADADRLRTLDDIDRYAVAGFSLFTIDPGEHIDSTAEFASIADLCDEVDALPWTELEISPDDLGDRYIGQSFDLEDRRITLDAVTVLRATAKFGPAIVHIKKMARYLASLNLAHELEISLDGTGKPTTHAQHLFVAAELRRLGVRWVSLAPRFVGRFDEGVDYAGNLHELASHVAGHAAIARALGPYKLSLHSGSDKFNIYPLLVAATLGRVHIKTDGTSYLEELRTLARIAPALFRDILTFAGSMYWNHRAICHVYLDLEGIPDPANLDDSQLPALLDLLSVRQIMQITSGSVLTRFGEDMRAVLKAHEAEHYEALHWHFVRHLESFAR